MEVFLPRANLAPLPGLDLALTARQTVVELSLVVRSFTLRGTPVTFLQGENEDTRVIVPCRGWSN